MNLLARRITGDRRFERLIIALIVFNGVLVGLETSATVVERAGTLIEWAHHLILAAFVAEVVLKLAAVAPAWRRYFGDSWNMFDFTIVVLSLLPVSGELSMVARMRSSTYQLCASIGPSLTSTDISPVRPSSTCASSGMSP